MQTEATITCPDCRSTTLAEMPLNACQYFWDCPACGALVRPKPGDCCVFCSWSDAACPPVQTGGACCQFD